MLRIRSKILGCEIGAVEDEAERQRARENGVALVLYSRDEMERMRGLLPDDIRSIHETKRMVGGVYVGPSVRPDSGTEGEPLQVGMFDALTEDGDGQVIETVVFVPPPEWGDEVLTPSGTGTVVGVSDSSVTVQLDSGRRETFRLAEVTA